MCVGGGRSLLVGAACWWAQRAFVVWGGRGGGGGGAPGGVGGKGGVQGRVQEHVPVQHQHHLRAHHQQRLRGAAALRRVGVCGVGGGGGQGGAKPKGLLRQLCVRDRQNPGGLAMLLACSNGKRGGSARDRSESGAAGYVSSTVPQATPPH